MRRASCRKGAGDTAAERGAAALQAQQAALRRALGAAATVLQRALVAAAAVEVKQAA